MFRNYLTIAVRNLWKNRFYSMISISGLAISIACCLLMLVYLHDEWTYDQFNHQPEKVVRVVFDNYLNQGKYATTPLPVGPALAAEFPEVEAMTRVSQGLKSLVRFKEKKFFERLTFVDPGVATIFSMPLVAGDIETALDQPNQLIISESYANKYFGDQDPVGQTLNIGSSGSLNSTVTGVFRDFPQNSSIRFDIALPFATFEKVWGPANLWRQMPGNYTFLRLNERADAQLFAAKLPNFTRKYVAEELTDWERQYQLRLQPLLDVHLRSDYGRESGQGDTTTLYLLALIALLVLVIASINYVNYVTARFSKRAREVGIRKVIGASRRSLVGHFLSETFLTAAVAGVFAIVLAELLLPAFNFIAGRNFQPEHLRQLLVYAAAGGAIVMVAFGAGIFPALFLSGFRPVYALQGKLANLPMAGNLRKGLVVVQFTASVALLITTLIVWQQMKFVRHNIQPISSEQVAVFQINDKLAAQFDVLKQQLLNKSGVLQVSGGSNIATFTGDSWDIQLDINSPQVQTENYAVEDDFIETLGYEIVAGRALDPSLASDVKAGFVLNETAVAQLGFATPDEALGKQIWWGGDRKKGYIVGVVKDFHFQSLHEAVKPAMLQFAPYEWMTSQFAAVRFQPQGAGSLHQDIARAVTAIDPAWHADVRYLDENFMKAHEKDLRQGRIFGAFAGMALFISCLGLLGLAAFAAEQRVKEIGIRKVLGATTAAIVSLLSKDLLKLVIVAMIIAAPLAWYFMEQWLQDFAYRIDIEWWVFAVAGAVAVAVAFLTISFQSIKAALSNPVKSLRME